MIINDKPVTSNSAILDVTSYNIKGVLLPRVDIVDVFDNTRPVNHPANGLIVFNKGNTIISGVYVWRNSK